MKKNKETQIKEIEALLDKEPYYICCSKNFIIARGSGLNMMLLVSRILEEVTKGIDPEVFCDVVLGYLKHKDTME